MRQREVMFLAAGLVVGVALSVLLFSSGALNGFLTGTVLSPANSSYLLADMTQARTWVLENSGATTDSDTLAAAIDEIDALPTAENFRQGLRDAEGAIDTFLTQSYTSIGGTAESAQADQPETSACLGMDDDPYNTNGPVLYLYVKVPEDRAGELPDTWTRLDAPKENDLYWQLLSCQQG